LPYQLQTTNVQTQLFNTAIGSNPFNGYDLVGTPTAIRFGDHTSEALAFGYNELDQLLSMAGSASDSYGSYIQSGTYDIGNLLIVGGHSLGYTAPPHAPTSATGIGPYSYDGNGNRLADPTYGYGYDGENHLTSLTQGPTTILQNTFDGDGARLVRAVGSALTHYVGGWYEANPTSGVATAYYPFNGVPIALKQGSSLSYLHHDHLGSLVSLTDTSGTEQWWGRYAPFGTLRLTGGLVPTTQLPTDRLFTGQTRDLGSDAFYFFKARYYDATIGKFHTPDTVVPDPKNPQALNRYAYAYNNPLKFVDPSGHASVDPGSQSGWDPIWVAQWEAAHRGQGMPSQQDWADYQFSLRHSGGGPNGTWTAADWADYSKTGYLDDRTFTQTSSFWLYGPADSTGPSEVINPVTGASQPVPANLGDLWGQFGVNRGQIRVTVHERTTGAGTHIDVWAGTVSQEPVLELNGRFVVYVGAPPRQGVRAFPGTLSPSVAAALVPAGWPSAVYAGSVDIPANQGMAYQIAVSAPPWSPGSFGLAGNTGFVFNL
jgi:RHS repeat-associated protein